MILADMMLAGRFRQRQRVEQTGFDGIREERAESGLFKRRAELVGQPISPIIAEAHQRSLPETFAVRGDEIGIIQRGERGTALQLVTVRIGEQRSQQRLQIDDRDRML